MCINRGSVAVRAACASVLWAAWASGLSAQLVVTEFLANPLTTNDVYEWIEVLNASDAAIDLDGYYADRLGDPAIPETGSPNVTKLKALNTVIPAGQTAVLYAGNLAGTNNDFQDDKFRAAWGLAPSVPLIGVDFWPPLTNSGASFGFWPDRAAYDADLVDNGEGTLVVGSFQNAAFSLDFRAGFPLADGASAEWNGFGSNQDPANWNQVTADYPGAVTSAAVFSAGVDVGSPGRVPGGFAPTGLLITEIMYNPSDAEPAWEWVEIFNNTGATIDFGATPYVYHDDDLAPLAEPNLVAGVIGQGETAVIYRGDRLSLDEVQSAWDAGGAAGVNFIAAQGGPDLGNSGDTVAFWSSLDAYLSEAVTGPGRTTANALAVVNYDDDGVIWPADGGTQSIALVSLGAAQNEGASWDLSFVGDATGSFVAQSNVKIYDGGDLGTPGTFVPSGPSLTADFDGDGDVDAADLILWEDGFGGARSGGELLAWQREFGVAANAVAVSAVPEFASCALALLAACATFARRQRD